MKYQNIVLVLAYSAVFAVAQDDAEGSENPCVAQRTALEACGESNGCLQESGKCSEDIFSDGFTQDSDPFGGAAPDLTDMDALVAQINTFVAGMCDKAKGQFCRAKECCPECNTELDEAIDCQLAAATEIMESGMSGMQDTLGMLGGVLAGVTGETPAPTGEGDEPPALPEFDTECNVKEHTCTPRGEGGEDESSTSTNSESAADGSSEAKHIGLLLATTITIATTGMSI